MTFKPAAELSEREKAILDMAREVGYDHMASMWNTVDKRLMSELEGYTIGEAITAQVNTGVRAMMFLICQILTCAAKDGITGETPEELVTAFSKSLIRLVRGELESRKLGMN